MGQQDISDFLEKNKGRWYTAKKLSKHLKISIASITASLSKLRKRKTIKCREGYTTAIDGTHRRCLMYRV